MNNLGFGLLGVIITLLVLGERISRVRAELAGIREELARLRKMVP